MASINTQGAPEALRDDPQSGDCIGGKYRLVEPIARGGMGTVWRARHAELDVPVAVKLMLPTMQGDVARARFAREAKAAALIRCPHVVHVHDFGFDRGRPFMAMELIEGENLLERIKRVGAMGLAETSRVIEELCRGIERAHDKGIIHRDLKPANVLLATHDQDMVKILDFGVAKPISGALAAEESFGEMMVGSPQYMAPEQIRGGRVDNRTDLWAVAVIAYRMLTAQLPFVADGVGEVLVKICCDDFAAPSQHCPELPPAIDAFFVRGLSRDPGQRFANAHEFAAAFSGACGLLQRDSRPWLSSVDAEIPTIALAGDDVEERSATLVQMVVSQHDATRVIPFSARPRLARAVAVAKLALLVLVVGTVGYHLARPVPADVAQSSASTAAPSLASPRNGEGASVGAARAPSRPVARELVPEAPVDQASDAAPKSPPGAKPTSRSEASRQLAHAPEVAADAKGAARRSGRGDAPSAKRPSAKRPSAKRPSANNGVNPLLGY